MTNIFDVFAEKIVDRLIRRVGMDGIRIATVNVQPGDLVIVDVQSDGEIPVEKFTRIEREWDRIFPNNRVVVTNGFNLSLIHAPERPLGGRY